MKELREHRGIYGGVSVGAILLYVFILTRVEGEAGALFFAGFPVWVTAALLPFALARSFSGEWKASTHYFLLSLPVRSGTIALAKWLAPLTAAVLIFSVSLAGIDLIRVEFEVTGQLLEQFGATPRAVLRYVNTQYLATVVLLLGVAMAWVGVRQTVTGHGLVVGSLYVILTFFLYFQFMSPFHHLVGDVPSVWVPVIYSFTFGLAYTMAGFILFDRFTEI
ncbi:MAG: hypothetical protein CME26_09725 [Gemmatimonadetes bacterium]|nr:hypothetical protein [Gemmatimonadota bacterium]